MVTIGTDRPVPSPVALGLSDALGTAEDALAALERLLGSGQLDLDGGRLLLLSGRLLAMLSDLEAEVHRVMAFARPHRPAA